MNIDREETECEIGEGKQTDSMYAHMMYCRSLLKTPDNEVLAESIKSLISERDTALNTISCIRNYCHKLSAVDYKSGTIGKTIIGHIDRIMESK